MKVKVIGHTQVDNKIDVEEIKRFSGVNAGVCYMPDNWETLCAEDREKSLNRANRNLESGHHSVYDHYLVNFVFEDIPKFIAMIFNNQGVYSTSEKSARYTKMKLTKKEQALYDKWYAIFLELINKKYPIEKYKNCAFWGLTEKANLSKRTKLAQENARYLISVFTPTTMVHSMNIRQFNYVCKQLEDFAKSDIKSPIFKKGKKYIEEFLKAVPSELLINNLDSYSKHSKLRFYDERNYLPAKIYDDIYQTNYLGSLAQLAQAQRHRTLIYTIKELDQPEYFIPPILQDNENLKQEYLKDVKSLEKNVPQATMVRIFESGTLDYFILKMKERKCSYAQKEINDQTEKTLQEYVKSLKQNNHPRAVFLEKYTHGARCTFPDYKCLAPCGFAEGINLSRII